MIKIICMGKLKEKFYKEAMNEYLKRLEKYHKIIILELPDSKDDDIKRALEIEKNNLLNHIKEKENIVLLDIEAPQKSSEEFASFIDKELMNSGNITFIIGSSNGLNNEIKELTTKKISFSKLTFPHQLFRIILIEQIYRSFKIINNEKYHK